MKQCRWAVLLLASAILMSCFSMRQGIVNVDHYSKDEVVLTDELKTLLRDTVKPKVVFRTPNVPSNVTETEKYNTCVNGFEKALIRKGFTVRDRALLENLLRSGNTDYLAIRDKIDTDIIIEILSLEFNLSNYVKEYTDKLTGAVKSFQSPLNHVDCQMAKLQARVTIVSKGQLGGMLALYTTCCQEQEILIQGNLLRWPGKDGFETLVCLAGSDSEWVIEILADKLVKIIDASSWVGGGKAGAYLGLRLRDVDAGYAKQRGLSDTQGALVAEVDAGSPAADAGLLEGDVIVRIGDHPVNSAGDLVNDVASKAPGDQVRVVFRRPAVGYGLQERYVTLGKHETK